MNPRPLQENMFQLHVPSHKPPFLDPHRQLERSTKGHKAGKGCTAPRMMVTFAQQTFSVY